MERQIVIKYLDIVYSFEKKIVTLLRSVNDKTGLILIAYYLSLTMESFQIEFISRDSKNLNPISNTSLFWVVIYDWLCLDHNIFF
jgi:hypothetical protein